MQTYKIVLPLCLTWAATAYANTVPVADFDVSGIQDLKISLVNQSSDPDGDKLLYKWSFGDGKTSKEMNPEHVYEQSGVYKITLKVSDGVLAAKSARTVTVKNNRPPVADFEVSSNRDMTVKLVNKSSDPDSDKLSYKWSFGDGEISKEISPEHTYKNEGTYKITLKVSDGTDAIKAVKTVTVHVNHEPVADFDVRMNNLKVAFENKSTDPDGDALKYKWSFGDGTTLKETSPVHTYAAPGEYKVVLYTSDGIKTVKTSRTITVRDGQDNQDPVAAFDVSSNRNLKVKLLNKSSDPDHDQLRYKWSFGDGQTSTEASPEHTYENAGTYKITLKVSDGTASAKTAMKVAVSANQAPVAAFDIASQQDRTVTFESISSDPDGDALKYKWSFGDGTTSKEKDPVHTYESFGKYKVVLQVSDGLDRVKSSRVFVLDQTVDFSLNGQVLSYLKGARVCLDFNNDSLCSQDEPVAVTDANGIFSFNGGVSAAGMRGTPFECILEGSCTGELPLKVVAYAAAGTSRYTLGKENFLSNGIAMSATAFITADEGSGGVPVFSSGKSLIINPYTTLVDYVVRNNEGLTQYLWNFACSQVAAVLSVNPKDVLSDYNDPAAVTEKSRKALIVGEVLSRSGMLPDSPERMREMGESSLSIRELVSSSLETVQQDVELIMARTSADDPDGIADALDIYGEEAESSMVKLAGKDSDEFKCAVSKAKNVFCWGFNGSGNLGDPEVFPLDVNGEPADGFSVDDNFVASPVKVRVGENSFLSNVTALDSGNGHACAVTYDGAVYCWGSNWMGQAGTGEIGADGGRVFFATRVVKGEQYTEGKNLGNVASVTLAHNSSCALTRDGEVFCWGENSAMQLGASHPEDEIRVFEGRLSINDGVDLGDLVKAVPYPVKVTFPSSVKSVSRVVAGLGAYCALVENNDSSDEHNLYCWGNDSVGIVSHNWKQYQSDWLTNYADRVHFLDYSALADPEGSAPWFWKLYDESGDFHFIYGAPVSRVDEADYPGKERFEFANVTQAGITANDTEILVERNSDGRVYGVYNGGTADRTYTWQMADSPTTFNGENVADLALNVGNGASFVLGDGGYLYALDICGRYGMYGTGSRDVTCTEWTQSVADGADYAVIAPLSPVFENGKKLGNVVAVSVGKRSVCAVSRRMDEDGSATSFTDTYCWGSSTFGQLGFDDHDGGFSFKNVVQAWSGHDDINVYFDKQSRMVPYPRKVEFR